MKFNKNAVLPRMREWIEMAQTSFLLTITGVLPRMREWIEILILGGLSHTGECSPSYEGVD